MARRRRADRRRQAAEARRPVRWTPVIGLSVVLLLGGWTLLWFFARAEALSSFAQWRDGERAFGRAWTCPDQRVSGFPLSITLTCEHPTFKGPVADGIYDGSVAHLAASAQLYFPTRVVVTLDGPLQATEVASRRQVEATWSSAAVTLRGSLPNALDRALIEMAEVRVLDRSQPQDAVQVGRVSLGIKPIVRPTDARADLDTTLEVDDLRVPALDASLGSSDPIRLRFTGFATQVRFDGGATAADVLGPWSRAGGQVHLQSLDVDKGPLRIKASGRFGLDDEHRLEGRVDAGFTGLSPIADRLGLPLDVLKVGGALASLIGGGNTGAGDSDSELTLPITAKNGALTVGPVRTRITLLPVY